MTPKEYLKANETISIKTNKDGSKQIIRKPSSTAVKNLEKVEEGLQGALSKVREKLAQNSGNDITQGYTNAYYSYHNLNSALTKAEKGTDLVHSHSTAFKAINYKGVAMPKFCVYTILQYKWLTLRVNYIPTQKGSKRQKMETESQVFGGTVTSAERQSLMATFGIGPSSNSDDGNGNGNVNTNNGGGTRYSGNQNGFNGGGRSNFNQAGTSQTDKSSQPTNTRMNSTATSNSNNTQSSQTASNTAKSSATASVSASSSSSTASKTSQKSASTAKTSSSTKPKSKKKKPTVITVDQKKRAVELSNLLKTVHAHKKDLSTAQLVQLAMNLGGVAKKSDLNRLSATEFKHIKLGLTSFIPHQKSAKKSSK